MQPRFNGQPQIDAYGGMGFRLAGQRFEGSILLTPRGLYPWAVASTKEASVATLRPIFDAAADCDFFIVGCGQAFTPFSKGVLSAFSQIRTMPDFMDTGAACRTYNVLRAEDRRVAAALIAVA